MSTLITVSAAPDRVKRNSKGFVNVGVELEVVCVILSSKSEPSTFHRAEYVGNPSP